MVPSFVTFPFVQTAGNDARVREAIAAAKTGDHVVLADHGTDDNWRPHPDGFVLLTRDGFRLNGEVPVGAGKPEEEWYPDTNLLTNWMIHPEGIVRKMRRRSLRSACLVLNDERVIYEVESRTFRGWQPHVKGFVVEERERLLLNGVTPVYEAPTLGLRWFSGKDVIVTYQNGFVRIVGENDGFPAGLRDICCNGHGLMQIRDGGAYLNGHRRVADVRGTPEEWVQWMAVPGGIVAWERETDVLRLNGERQLFFAPIAAWFDHPHGFVVQQPGGRITLVVVRDPRAEGGAFNPDQVMCE